MKPANRFVDDVWNSLLATGTEQATVVQFEKAELDSFERDVMLLTTSEIKLAVSERHRCFNVNRPLGPTTVPRTGSKIFATLNVCKHRRCNDVLLIRDDNVPLANVLVKMRSVRTFRDPGQHFLGTKEVEHQRALGKQLIVKKVVRQISLYLNEKRHRLFHVVKILANLLGRPVENDKLVLFKCKVVFFLNETIEINLVLRQDSNLKQNRLLKFVLVLFTDFLRQVHVDRRQHDDKFLNIPQSEIVRLHRDKIVEKFQCFLVLTLLDETRNLVKISPRADFLSLIGLHLAS